MELQEFLEKKIKKGAYYRMQYATDMGRYLSASYKGSKLIKKTQAVARFGINYYNMKAHKDFEHHELKGLQWEDDGNRNMLLTNVKGEYLIRYYMSRKPRSEYIFNGQTVTKEWLQENKIVQPSYWNRTPSDTFNIKLSNIVSIGA